MRLLLVLPQLPRGRAWLWRWQVPRPLLQLPGSHGCSWPPPQQELLLLLLLLLVSAGMCCAACC
jgi:hypothetical protein